uniref:Myb-like domain-containing protein n=1 Tax=Brassica oleracea var. oleracea TaxID=109376 RepID=A0A0D3DHW0_BRAOL
MDSTNSHTQPSNFVDLLNRQQDTPFPYASFPLDGDIRSSQLSLFSTQATATSNFYEDSPTQRKGRKKWSPSDDLVLISAWLNTSKDPIVGNEQKAGAFWKRIANYYGASPKVGGGDKPEPMQCKQSYETKKSEVLVSVLLERSRDGVVTSNRSQAPQVTFSVDGREYHLAYYLTDGIYPKWATFIQSISIPQGPKAVLFAQHQEAVRKDVERAFGVLQARFAIVKNPALFWDKAKIRKIMRACIILHNMIVEDERDGYTHFDVSEFQQGEDTGTSHVDLTYSTDIPSNIANMMGVRTRIRDRQMHQQLKADLVEHIWRKFGPDGDNY